MSVNQNIEILAAQLLKLVKPEVENDPRMLQACTVTVHIGANLLMDIKRIAVALEAISKSRKFTV